MRPRNNNSPPPPPRLVESEPLISEEDLCRILDLSPKTVRKMAKAGVGPPRLKVSARKIRYRRADVESYLGIRKGTNT